MTKYTKIVIFPSPLFYFIDAPEIDMKKTHKIARPAGFTLVEVMVVVVILGILAAMILPKIMSRPEQARLVKTKQDILAIQNSLDLYKLDNGFYPSTDQGLQALVINPTTPPVPHDWKEEGYLQDVPVDPWGQTYQYLNDNEKIKIFSYGPKGKDSDSEISNENLSDHTG
jgi:general secretion pathway protein G